MNISWVPPGEKHVDDLIDDEAQPKALRDFLHYHRLPAVCKLAGQPQGVVNQCLKYINDELKPFTWTDPEPVCFADFEGRRVRMVMASRMGDVGISFNVHVSRGYAKRVWINELSNFSEKP